MTNDAKLETILYAWERRRLTYNVVLFVIGAALVAYGYRQFRVSLSDLEIAAACVGVGIAANLAYFAGPIAEMYSLVFFNREWLPPLRNLVYVVGLGFSVLVLVGGAFAAMVMIALSNQ
ncbi:MAG: hypothetical protein HZC41_03725 [Chloroflexi bacterium]|nr:hypothetical protein [Chloroflexota bacterium]